MEIAAFGRELRELLKTVGAQRVWPGGTAIENKKEERTEKLGTERCSYPAASDAGVVQSTLISTKDVKRRER